MESYSHSKKKRFSFALLIPNMITVCSTCAALTAVRFAMDERFKFAAFALLIAAILDGLDGRVARLLKVTSDFGAQMDSLSDGVAFGVVPALIIYYWALHHLGGPFGGFGWAIALFYAICCILRLARFNSRLTKLPDYAQDFFQGVPAPAGAGLVIMPLILSFILQEFYPDRQLLIPPEAVAVWTAAVGLLMISELPTFAFKKLKVPSKLILPILALAALVFATILRSPWISFFVLLSLYTVSIPFSFIVYRKRQLAMRNHEPTSTESQTDE